MGPWLVVAELGGVTEEGPAENSSRVMGGIVASSCDREATIGAASAKGEETEEGVDDRVC